MNKNSPGFTFLFATVMVVIVAVVLALAAIILGPYQQKNIRLEKMQNILTTIGVNSTPAEAGKLFTMYVF